MAKTCGWCGRQIGFTDMDYEWVPVGLNEYYICGKCRGEIAGVKSGFATYDGIKTENTAPELLVHFKRGEIPSEEVIQKENARKEQQRIKTEVQQINPLLDDIHQIAGDLRFIKNYLIFTIVTGIILAVIYLTT